MPGLGCGRRASIKITGNENKVCLQWTHQTTLHTDRKCSLAARRGRRRKQLLDGLNETREYLKLKEEALDRALWRTRFGKGYGSVVTETTECKTLDRIKTEGVEYVALQAVLTQIVFHMKYE